MAVSGGFAAVSSHSIINIIKATAIPKSHHCESFLADLLKTLKCNKITNINMKPYYNLKIRPLKTQIFVTKHEI